MYIMKKMNREKKAATEEERNVLLLVGYVDVTPVKKEESTPETSKEAETPVEEQAEELSDTDVKEEKRVSKKKV